MLSRPSVQMSHFICKPQNLFSLSKAILLIWVEAVMARTWSHKTTKNTIYSYEWYIISVSPFSLPFQTHLKTVFLKSLLQSLVFQFFRLSGPPHLQLHPPGSSLSSFTLAHPLGHCFNLSSSEELSLTHCSKWFCALFSLQYSVLFSPDSAVVYIILIFFTISPQHLLQILHTVGPQEAHLTGTRLHVCWSQAVG